MSELFDKDRQTISEHIQNIFTENELQENSVCWKFRLTPRIVSVYLDFAELQALNQKPMYMADWSQSLITFFR